MRTFFLLFIILLSPTLLRASDVTLEGWQSAPVKVDVPAATGLSALYVVRSVDGLRIVYTPNGSASSVSWSRYGNRGAAYAEEIPSSQISVEAGRSVLTAVSGDAGYVISDDTSTTYIWISDYSAHPCTIRSLSIGQQDCSQTELIPDGSAPRMIYYDITGRNRDIDRGIELSYSTLEPSADKTQYVSKQIKTDLPYFETETYVESPLCDTYFTLTGDRFLRAWGQPSETVSQLCQASAVGCFATATEHKTEADNQIKTSVIGLGGSAPVEIDFKASVSDAVVFTQWQFTSANDPDFEDIIYRNSDLELSYTFTEMGNYLVRFMAANAAGDCEAYSETFTVSVGESRLECPNAFSPIGSEGVNDIWKVSYKSIVKFDCYIFNRWGKKLYEFHDPSGGWDGKDGGKVVDPGVYYYVIKARGADGKDYDLSGDINIIGYTGR